MGKENTVKYTRVIGAIIKQLRKKENVNQEEFSYLLDLHQSGFTRIENGLRTLSISQIWKISSLLGYTTSEFMRIVEIAIDKLSIMNITILYNQESDSYESFKLDIAIGLALLECA